jgi:hypothetical protein
MCEMKKKKEPPNVRYLGETPPFLVRCEKVGKTGGSQIARGPNDGAVAQHTRMNKTLTFKNRESVIETSLT